MNYSIHQYPFDQDIEDNIFTNHLDYLNWPLVYFLEQNTTNDELIYDAYGGETTDVVNRLKLHSKTEKNKI